MSPSDPVETEPARAEDWPGDTDQGPAASDQPVSTSNAVHQTSDAYRAAALQRIEDGLGAIADRIARMGSAPQPHDAVRPLSRPAATGFEEPWDAQSAEALTRICELAQSEVETPAPRRLAEHRHQQHAVPPASEAAPGDHAHPELEARIASIAAMLEETLSHSQPSQELAALNTRIERFEARLEANLERVALRSDVESLARIEAHVNELATHFEQARRQLARIDSIEETLRELSESFSDRAMQLEPARPALDDAALQSLAEAAAERTANRLAAATPPAPAPGNGEQDARIEALEGMLQDYISERRRGEDVTAGILQTIEEALVRIVDRIDAMEADGVARSADQDDTGSETDRLAAAYAMGETMLRPDSDEPSLHAADYAPTAMALPAEHAPKADAAKANPAAEDLKTKAELRASALRAKLKAEAVLPSVPPVSSAPPSTAARGGLARRVASGGSRFGLLLAAAALFLFSGSYLIFDRLLMRSAAPSSQAPTAAQPAVESTGSKSLPPGTPNDRAPARTMQPDVAPAADTEPAPPRRRHVPETVTDDLGANEPRANAANPLSLGSAAPAVTRVATGSPSAPDTGADPAGLASTREDLPPIGIEVMPPAAIGTTALRNAAASGERLAEFEVASRFAEGKGVAQDLRLAFVWYRRAAAHGLAAAQFRLGAYYERGIGTSADIARAKVWYHRAADQGHIKAMHNLGVLTIGDSPDADDFITAARLFSQAAEHGLADSQFNLAILYETGRGVAKDVAESYKWFTLAARQGDKDAGQHVARIKAMLEAVDLKAAEDKVAAWRPLTADPGVNGTSGIAAGG